MTDHTSESIRKHWDEIATKWQSDPRGAMPDANLRELELNAILHELPEGGSMVDVGCGNGAITLKIANHFSGDIIGVDFSGEMIKQANLALEISAAPVRKQVAFQVGDVCYFQPPGPVTAVIGCRCLINLTSADKQREALKNISDMLEPGGVALLSEDTLQGYEAINRVRSEIDLPSIDKRWHNLPIDESLVRDAASKIGLEVVGIDDFSSTYYLVSRAINIKFAELRGGEVPFYNELDMIGAKIPAVGNFGLLRLIRLRKSH